MILYSFILYNYYDLYRFHGTHIQIYPSSSLQTKNPATWRGLMLICFYGLKIVATYLPLISFFPKKFYNISCLIMGYRRAFRNRILLSLSIINRLRPCLISLVFVFILIPILLFHKNHLDVVPTYKFPNS